MARRAIIGWILTAIVTGFTLFGLWVWQLSIRAPTSPVASQFREASPRPDMPNTGNDVQDRIAALPTPEQAMLLGKMVGPSCIGIRAFAMGLGKHDADKGDAYWSVQCADGKSYAVAFHPDKAASSGVLSCEAMQAAGMECFKRLPR
jgi:hypothetical protein